MTTGFFYLKGIKILFLDDLFYRVLSFIKLELWKEQLLNRYEEVIIFYPKTLTNLHSVSADGP